MAAAKKRERMKSIARIDQERRYKTTKGKWSTKTTRGWYVQVVWNRKAHTKFFSDQKFGGIRKALRAAMEWRDMTEQKIGKPQVHGTVLHPKVRGRDRGPGLCITSKDGGPVYQLFWVDDSGNYGRTTVSIRKWGKKGAKERAEQIRDDLRRKYYRDNV
jgi:hypothetical protein